MTREDRTLLLRIVSMVAVLVLIGTGNGLWITLFVWIFLMAGHL